MSFVQAGKNGATSDTPAREFGRDEHGDGMNPAGEPWRGGHSREGGRRGRGGGRRQGNYDRDTEWRRGEKGGEGSSWRRGDDDREGEGVTGEGRGWQARGGRGGGGYNSHNNRGGRGGRNYGSRARGDQLSSWRHGDEQPEERAGNGERYDGGRGRGRGGYVHDDAEPRQTGRFDVDTYDRPRGDGRGNRDRPHRGGRGGYSREARDDRPQQEQEPQQQQQQQQPEEAQEQGEEQRRPRVQEDPISTNPNRTQRAPHLRKNCHDEREIEQLFEHHHQQKGISLDNYANIPVDIIPKNIDPVESFEDLFVEPALSSNIIKCGYKQPTPVQRYGIPVSLNGDDLMACAQTGSGKTAAFLVPVVHYILKHGVSPARNRTSYPIAVIMAPTRELALQIYDEVRKLTFRTDIFHDVVYGGTPYPTRFENDILVACPGRLKDIFDRNIVSFSRVKFLVLDEADRMLEMGFEEQIEYLVASRYTDMPPTSDRQTLMFSATFPQRILNLAKRYLRQQYYLLTVGRVGSTTKNITQKIEKVQDSEKVDKLFETIYQQKQTDLVLIFVETKRAAEDLHYALRSEGIPSATIHGDRKQADRERALRDFKDGVTPILVATDVASRGLDIPNVAHVIQYDLPKEMDDYTHRIGRTGRAGNKGIATSFYNKNNRNLAVDLYNYLKEHEQDIPFWLEEEKENVEGERFIGMNRRRGGGEGSRAAPVLSNSTWGESAAFRGRARGGGQSRNTSNVDDGGF